MKILVINAGSSSLKYQLIDMSTEEVLAKGLCERIGIDGHLKHTPLVGDKPKFDEDVSMPTHSEAIAAVIDKLTSAEYGVVSSMKEIDAVGHRLVHGGEKFASSVQIDDEVMDAVRECIPFAPCTIPLTSPESRPAGRLWVTSPWLPCSIPPSIRPCLERPLCMLCRMIIMRRTASVATASTAPPTAMFPPAVLRCWVNPLTN